MKPLRTIGAFLIAFIITFTIIMVIGATRPLIISGYQGLNPSYVALQSGTTLYTPSQNANPPGISSLSWGGGGPVSADLNQPGGWYAVCGALGCSQTRLNSCPFLTSCVNYGAFPSIWSNQGPVTADQAQPSKYWRISTKNTTVTADGSSAYTFPNGTIAPKGTTLTYGSYNYYELDLYYATWGINIWIGKNAYSDVQWFDNPGLQNLKLWMQFNSFSPQFFQGSNISAYFALALMQTQTVTWTVGNNNQGFTSCTIGSGCSPSSGDSIPSTTVLPIAGIPPQYADICGSVNVDLQAACGTAGAPTTDNLYTGQIGRILDPTIFKPNYYTHLDIGLFAPKITCGAFCALGNSVEYIAINIRFNIHIFVFGQWTVQLLTSMAPPPGPIIPGCGVGPCTNSVQNAANGFWNWLTGFTSFLGTPVAWLLAALLVGAILAGLFLIAIIILGVRGSSIRKSVAG